MKNAVLNYEINIIKKYNPDYDEDKLAEICYWLEVYYINITKSIFIFSVAFIFGVFKEMLVMLVVFNILRRFGFGLHATKSWICLLSSTSIFILFPTIAKYITIPLNYKYILGIIAILLMYKYAPADTIKRPLIKKEVRDCLKFRSTILCIVLVFCSIFIKNNTLSNLFIFGIYCEIFMIHPFVYKFFNLSYNNYENYVMD